jgi:hypothetical protein
MGVAHDDLARARVEILTDDDVIYFFEQPSAGVYLGQTSAWPRRRDAHLAAGRRFLAFMRGSYDFEQRLHAHFAPDIVPVPKCQSVYRGERVLQYLEWLVEAGLATVDEHDLPHLPPLLWEAIDPAVPRRPMQASRQLMLLGGDEDSSPLARVRRSARFACYSSETNEWYTPASVIAAARSVMGDIDLDPASCPVANRTVGARAYYSQRQDGLHPSRPWLGRVWLNPPYGGEAAAFTNRLVAEVSVGNVTQAFALLSSQAVLTQWAEPAVRAASALGFSRGRWEFAPGHGQAVSSPAGGSSLLYFGPRVEAFAAAFDKLAHVLRPCW